MTQEDKTAEVLKLMDFASDEKNRHSDRFDAILQAENLVEEMGVEWDDLGGKWDARMVSDLIEDMEFKEFLGIPHP